MGKLLKRVALCVCVASVFAGGLYAYMVNGMFFRLVSCELTMIGNVAKYLGTYEGPTGQRITEQFNSYCPN